VHGGPAPVNGGPTLSRSLIRLDLVVIEVAQIIGAGIFAISGVGVEIAGLGLSGAPPANRWPLPAPWSAWP
jgi:hypothetical protein